MSGRPDRWLTIVITLLIILTGQTRAVAQVTATANLSTPDTTGFPALVAYLDVHDSTGEFIHGLTPQDVVIQEDNVNLPVDSLVESTPGVQYVLAITPGTSFSIRDADGISRFAHLRQGLLAGEWVSQTVSSDDLSLLAADGPQVIHTSNPADLASALETYQPGETDQTPGLEVLASALQVAADPTPRPGMERAILFITPPQEADNSMGLQSIIASARQQGIQISVWLLAAPEVFSSPSVEQLRTLADQTRGTFFAFSHDESVPAIESLLEPLRHVYQLCYHSQVTSSGSHQLVAQVTHGTDLITTPAMTFELDLQPPVVSILNPPITIDRAFSSPPTPGTASVAADLLPAQQIVHLQVDYPDGHDRSVALTRLYVDGTIAAENRTPPFDQLVWDLRPYTQDGSHTLIVEAVDSLGLASKTDETSVRIMVPSTTQGVLIAVSHKSPLLVGVAVLVTSSLLILSLILGGRIRPRPHPGQVIHPPHGEKSAHLINFHKARNRSLPSIDQVPETLNSKPARAASLFYRLLAHIPWLKPASLPNPANAYLVPLVGFDEPTLLAPLQINAKDVSLGSDPRSADLVIYDPSIESVHARISQVDTSFVIVDAGTVAGTWVNYEEVAASGASLHHMDIIHLGKIGFRFQLPEPGQLNKVIISPLEPQQ